MSQRKYNLVPGEFYHLYNRGTDKRNIFLDEADYRRFQLLLFLCNTSANINVRDFLKVEKYPFRVELADPLVSIGAYCLMPNHFHILATPRSDEGLSRFMQKLATSYSMYFNKKYERTGSLFQGKFKSELATEDRYLKYLISYIHLNPVKLIQSDWKERGLKDIQAAKSYLESYRFSSYMEMTGVSRNESAILHSEPFPQYFSSIESASREIQDWLTFSLGKT